jgi:hypothetical protein
LLRAGYEAMKQRQTKIPRQSKVRPTEANERLAQFYHATGKKDKADEWRKKLKERRRGKQQSIRDGDRRIGYTEPA